MMSRELPANSKQETGMFMQKVEEKKKVLAEAESNFNCLCSQVDKTNLELTGLKMERFKVERLVQELDSRVKVYEMREKELKELDERAKRSIKEAKNRLAEELEVRDSFGRKYSRKVIEMSSKYCQLRDSCLKTSVVSSLAYLKSSHTSFTAEIDSKMRDLGLGESGGNEDRANLLLQVYQPDQTRRIEISDVCELQKLIRAELESVKAENAEAATQIYQLQKKKSKLLEEINCLKKKNK